MLKFKRMKRVLRVTCAERHLEFTLNFAVWDALAQASEREEIPADLRSQLHGRLDPGCGSDYTESDVYTVLTRKRQVGGMACERGVAYELYWYSNTAPYRKPVYYLSELGEEVRAEMPPPPPVKDRPGKTASQASLDQKRHLLSDLETSILTSWSSNVDAATPLGEQEPVQDAWCDRPSRLYLRKLLQKGYVEMGMAFTGWNSIEGRFVPSTGKCPLLVWRMTPMAKLAYA